MTLRHVLKSAAGSVVLMTVSPEPAGSEEATRSYSGDVAVYGGALDVSDGIQDRSFTGLFANIYTDADLGFHLDISHQWREEDAGFVAIGGSAKLSPEFRTKLQIGSSTNNDGILPQLLLNGSVRYEPGATSGVVLDVAGVYRQYRNGVDEVSLRGEMIKYFAPFADASYVIGQAYSSSNYADPGSNLGWEVGAGATYVVPSAWSIGATVAAGDMAYDEVTARIGVENSFIALRPRVSFNLTDEIELFFWGDLLQSEEYDIAGGTAGLKIYFQ